MRDKTWWKEYRTKNLEKIRARDRLRKKLDYKLRRNAKKLPPISELMADTATHAKAILKWLGEGPADQTPKTP